MRLSRVSGFFAGVAAKDGKACLLGNATAWNACADQVNKLSRNEARIDLELAAHATPAHSIIVIVAALNGGTTALIVEQDARRFLQVRKDWNLECQRSSSATSLSASHLLFLINSTAKTNHFNNKFDLKGKMDQAPE